MSAEYIANLLSETTSPEADASQPPKLSKAKDELNKAIKWGLLLIGAPPALAMAASIALLSREIKLSTLQIEIDNNLIGAKFDTYIASDCHIGVHPHSNNKDLHIYCFKGNSPYIIIIPNIMP